VVRALKLPAKFEDNKTVFGPFVIDISQIPLPPPQPLLLSPERPRTYNRNLKNTMPSKSGGWLKWASRKGRAERTRSCSPTLSGATTNKAEMHHHRLGLHDADQHLRASSSSARDIGTSFDISGRITVDSVDRVRVWVGSNGVSQMAPSGAELMQRQARSRQSPDELDE
jgi:hypothetical protein